MMNISIHGDHVKITESIKEYVETKLNKLSKYFDESSMPDVIVKVRLRGRSEERRVGKECLDSC